MGSFICPLHLSIPVQLLATRNVIDASTLRKPKGGVGWMPHMGSLLPRSRISTEKRIQNTFQGGFQLQKGAEIKREKEGGNMKSMRYTEGQR